MEVPQAMYVDTIDDKESWDINPQLNIQEKNNMQQLIQRKHFEKIKDELRASDFKASILVNSGSTTYKL